MTVHRGEVSTDVGDAAVVLRASCVDVLDDRVAIGVCCQRLQCRRASDIVLEGGEQR